jgi:hypothetical protein
MIRNLPRKGKSQTGVAPESLHSAAEPILRRARRRDGAKKDAKKKILVDWLIG